MNSCAHRNNNNKKNSSIKVKVRTQTQYTGRNFQTTENIHIAYTIDCHERGIKHATVSATKV